jgi:hypothetical protein
LAQDDKKEEEFEEVPIIVEARKDPADSNKYVFDEPSKSTILIYILVIFQGSGDTIFTKLVTPAGVTIKAGDIYKVTILFKTLLGILRARPWQIQGSQLFHSYSRQIVKHSTASTYS